MQPFFTRGTNFWRGLASSVRTAKLSVALSHLPSAGVTSALVFRLHLDLYTISRAFWEPLDGNTGLARAGSMNFVYELSPDVLGLIVASTDSFYVFLRLWLCGNATLNAKLAKGVTRIRLLSNSADGASIFPRVVFSLRNLSSPDYSLQSTSSQACFGLV